MDGKNSLPAEIEPTNFRSEKIIEAVTWIIIVGVIFGVRFLPKQPIGNAETYYLIGGITALALIYYLLVYKYFSTTNRRYIRYIAGIVLIGILIHLLKDYGQFFFALYFLPIAAAALSLEFINALLIATIASLFVIFEIFLGSMNLLPDSNQVYAGFWQVAIILLITIFCRFLAVQIRQEKTLKEEALAREKALKEESKKEKEFMSLTSHQLFTPLSIIRGFTSMLYEKKLGKLNPKQTQAVSEIHGSVRRMVNLVSELFSITRIQTGSFKITKQETDLKKLLENIVSQYNKTIQIKDKKETKVFLEVSQDLQRIEIDADKVRQVIYNLIDNAIKYGKQGQIKITCSQNPKATTVSISDQGVGIAKEDYDKLFQPFFRGKNILELDNKGTGLGLYIARLIVEGHGGKIWVASVLGRGSTFNFSLPNS